MWPQNKRREKRQSQGCEPPSCLAPRSGAAPPQEGVLSQLRRHGVLRQRPGHQRHPAGVLLLAGRRLGRPLRDLPLPALHLRSVPGGPWPCPEPPYFFLGWQVEVWRKRPALARGGGKWGGRADLACLGSGPLPSAPTADRSSLQPSSTASAPTGRATRKTTASSTTASQPTAVSPAPRPRPRLRRLPNPIAVLG